MSEPIKVGDLVYVIRECCSTARVSGLIYKVDLVRRSHELAKTKCCGLPLPNVQIASGMIPDDRANIPFSWLKKIDPPALDEITDEREEISA